MRGLLDWLYEWAGSLYRPIFVFYVFVTPLIVAAAYLFDLSKDVVVIAFFAPVTLYGFGTLLFRELPIAISHYRARSGSSNPCITIHSDSIHLKFGSGGVVEERRTMILSATRSDICSMKRWMGWNGGLDKMQLTAQENCNIQPTQLMHEPGVVLEFEFPGPLPTIGTTEISYCITFDNSNGEIRQFLSASSDYKAKDFLKLKITVSEVSPVMFVQKILSMKSPQGTALDQKTYLKHDSTYEWPISRPRSDRVYRINWMLPPEV